MSLQLLMKHNPHKSFRHDNLQNSDPLFFVSTEMECSNDSKWKQMEFFTSLELVLRHILDNLGKFIEKTLFLFIFRLNDEVSVPEEDVLITDHDTIFLGSVLKFIIPYSSTTPFVELDLSILEPYLHLKENYHPSMMKDMEYTNNFWDQNNKTKIEWLFKSKDSIMNSILLASQLKKYFSGYYGDLSFDSKTKYLFHYKNGLLIYFLGSLSILEKFMEKNPAQSVVVYAKSTDLIYSIHNLGFTKSNHGQFKDWLVFESRSSKSVINWSDIRDSKPAPVERRPPAVQLKIKKKELVIPETIENDFTIPEFL